MTNELSQVELEEAYDLIAEAIDEVGPGDQSLFLAKLCLALANGARDVAAVRRAVDIVMDETAAAGPQDPATT